MSNKSRILRLWARPSCAYVALDAVLAALTYVPTRGVPGFTAYSAISRRSDMLDDPSPCANNSWRQPWCPDVIVEMGDFRAADAALPGNRDLRRGRPQAWHSGRPGVDHFDLTCRYGGPPQHRRG